LWTVMDWSQKYRFFLYGNGEKCNCVVICYDFFHFINIKRGLSVAEWLRSLTSNTLPLTLWVRIPTETLDSTQVPVRAGNNARRGTWDLPPPLKLERRQMTYTVPVRRKTQLDKQKYMKTNVSWMTRNWNLLNMSFSNFSLRGSDLKISKIPFINGFISINKTNDMKKMSVLIRILAFKKQHVSNDMISIQLLLN
jgi:hypothetical protein